MKNESSATLRIIMDKLHAEAYLHEKLDHSGLPRVSDVFKDDDSLRVVMGFIQSDDLLSIMKNHRCVITEADVVSWGIQPYDVLEHLHSRGAVYGDVIPGNIIFLSVDEAVLVGGIASQLLLCMRADKDHALWLML